MIIRNQSSRKVIQDEREEISIPLERLCYIARKKAGLLTLVALIGYSATDYNIGFSHDFLISGLMGFASGANEITVGFYFNRDKENVLRKFLNKRGKLSCPKF